MRDPETSPMPDWAGACSGLSSDEKEPEAGDEIKLISTSNHIEGVTYTKYASYVATEDSRN